jgi:hypothetical protein
MVTQSHTWSHHPVLTESHGVDTVQDSTKYSTSIVLYEEEAWPLSV